MSCQNMYVFYCDTRVGVVSGGKVVVVVGGLLDVVAKA